MRTYILIIVLLALSGLTAQSMLAQQRKSAAAQSTVKKTTAPKTVTTQPVIKVNFRGDLGQWALRGPVKRYVQDFDTIYFNRDGYRTEKDGRLMSSNAEEDITVTRNSEGRITSIKDDGFGHHGTYHYNVNGLMIKYYWVFGSRKMTRTYAYNSNGELIKRVWKETGGPQDGTMVTRYTILERDRYGNWTKRKVQNDNNRPEIETAVITYYEDASSSTTTINRDANAQKTDEAYPVGGWQSDRFFIIISRENNVFNQFKNRIGCGVMSIYDRDNQDIKPIFQGMLTYVGKEMKNEKETGSYLFNATTDQGKTYSINVNRNRKPLVLFSSGEYKDHPALKDNLEYDARGLLEWMRETYINTSTTRKHMKFLGLELGGKAVEFEKVLRGKGFTNGSGFDDSGNFLFLKGVVYGQMSEISIDVTNGRVNGVNVVNMTETEAKAISRYNVFKQHLASEYGEGYVPYENRYEISLPYGNAYTTYGTFDSGDIELGMHISDYEKVLTKIDYNINVFGIGSELVKDYTNWNNVRSTLKTNGYKVVSAATTQIRAVRQVGKFISNVTLSRANTQTTRIKSVIITTTNSLKDVEGYIQYSDYAFVQNSTQGGKLYKNEKCSMEVTEKDGVVTLCFTKTTPAAKQTTAQTTAISLSFTGPALVGGSLAYLGIPLSEKAEIIKTKLIAMGMKKRRIADDIEEFNGIVDGVKVRVSVGNSASGGSDIRQYDEKSYPLIKAKTRFNTLLNKIVGIYGNGNFDTNENDYKSYTIKNTHGTINVSLFNEDEMEGASPNYVIAVVLENT